MMLTVLEKVSTPFKQRSLAEFDVDKVCMTDYWHVNQLNDV